MGAVLTFAPCCGSRSYDVVGGKVIHTPSGYVELPSGAFGICAAESGDAELARSVSRLECPLALSNMLTKRGAYEEYAAFCHALSARHAPPVPCCASPALKYLEKKQTPADHRRAAVAAFVPRFCKHMIDLYLCQICEELPNGFGMCSTTWYTFVDRTENDTYVPDESIESCVQRPIRLSSQFESSIKDIGPSELPKIVREVGSSTASTTPTTAPTTPTNPRKVAELSGKWLLATYVGDYEDFLEDMGYGSRQRESAAAADYGTGTTHHTISLTGSVMEIEALGLNQWHMVQRLLIGAGEHRGVTLSGEPATLQARWSGSAGVLDELSTTDSGVTLRIRRYISGDQLVDEMSSPSGITVRRYFSKQ